MSGESYQRNPFVPCYLTPPTQNLLFLGKAFKGIPVSWKN